LMTTPTKQRLRGVKPQKEAVGELAGGGGVQNTLSQ